jgi:multidrug resistance efflux pump
MRKLLMLVVLLVAAGCTRQPGGADPGADVGDEPRLVCVGHVDVEGGVIALRPVRTGRLVEVAVREPQDVRAGAVLLRLDDEAAKLRVRQAEMDLKAAQLRLAQARKTPQQFRVDLALQKAALAAAEFRLAAARHALARKEGMQKRDLVGDDETKIAKDAVGEMQAALEAEKQKLERLELTDADNQVALAETDADAKQALLDEAKQALTECTLRAPADGEVLRVLVSPGEVLTTQTDVHFCPKQPRIVRAEVPQEFAGRVAVGQSAILEDDSQAGQTWTGKVVRVSDWFTQRRSVLQEPQERNDVRTLECIVQPDPSEKPLRIGQRIRVVLSTR